MIVIRYAAFLILSPIIAGLFAFFVRTYGTHDSPAWFQNVWSKKGAFLEKIFAAIVSPLYLVVGILLKYVVPFWEKVLDPE